MKTKEREVRECYCRLGQRSHITIPAIMRRENCRELQMKLKVENQKLFDFSVQNKQKGRTEEQRTNEKIESKKKKKNKILLNSVISTLKL